MIFVNTEKKYKDIFSVWKNWPKIDHEEFYKYKIKNLQKKESNDFAELKSSGSSSCCYKQYRWGPDFLKHHLLYDKIFYENQKFLKLFILSSKDGNLYRRTDSVLSLAVNNSIPENNDKIISDLHVLCNPEVMYIYMKRYGNFVEKFFDIKTCKFSFTGSALKSEFKTLFESFGMICKDHMRCWDGGATFFTCKHMNKHWVDFSSIIKFDGLKLISTDLWNLSQKFINYWNGDLMNCKVTGNCECGLKSISIDWVESPRYFVINETEHCYDAMIEWAKKYCKFDFLSVDFCDELVVVNVCLLEDNSELSDFQSYVQDKLKTKVIINKMKLPAYNRKYIRIKKIDKNTSEYFI